MDIPAALHQQLKDYMATSNNTSNDTTYNYSVNFNLLYSVYSIPNIFLPFFGGAIVDKLGPHNAAFIFATLTLIGQTIFALGVQFKSWRIMLLGRTFYGFGGENIGVATSTLNSIWFQGKELALSFGINLAVSRMGSVFNNLISPSLANHLSTPLAIWFGVWMNCLSLLAIGVVIYLSVMGERQRLQLFISTDVIGEELDLDENGAESLNAALLGDYDGQDQHILRFSNHNDTSSVEYDKENEGEDDDCLNDQNEVEEDTRKGTEPSLDSQENVENDILIENESTYSSLFPCINHVRKFSVMFWLLSLSCIVVYGCVLPFNNIASGVLLERNYFKLPPTDCTLTLPDQCSNGSLAPSGGNPSNDINGNSCPVDDNIQPILPQSIHIQSSTYDDEGWDQDSYQYNNLTSDDVDCGDPFWSEACAKDYCDAQKRATEKSGKIMSIPYFLSALLSPFFGHIIDKVGHRAFIACIAAVVLIIVHSTLAFSSASPVTPLIGQGLAYTMYASVIWPSVPLTVEEKSIGTAFGAITAIQNIGLALFPLIIAAIYTASGNSYIPNVELFFVSCAVCGTVIGFALNIFDSRHGGVLNKVQRRIVSI